MEARKEDRRARPGKSEQKRAAQGSTTGDMISSSSAAAATIITDSGHVLTISDYLSRFDEAAKRRLHNINQKLRRLEMQMDVLEAEISKADELSRSS